MKFFHFLPNLSASLRSIYIPSCLTATTPATVDDSTLGDNTEGGYGQKTSGYGDDTTEGGYGQQTGGYRDNGQKASAGYGDNAGQGGYGQKTSTGYGDVTADAGFGQKSTTGYGSQQKDSDGNGTPNEFQNSQFNRGDVLQTLMTMSESIVAKN